MIDWVKRMWHHWFPTKEEWEQRGYDYTMRAYQAGETVEQLWQYVDLGSAFDPGPFEDGMRRALYELRDNVLTDPGAMERINEAR